MPKGIPITMQSRVATDIKATVDIVFFHIPKYPISKNEIIAPTASFQLREPRYANPPTISIIIGHGVAFKSFSNQVKK
jgi:hypothetical protein